VQLSKRCQIPPFICINIVPERIEASCKYCFAHNGESDQMFYPFLLSGDTKKISG